jgi:anti-sigma regulatory factor (Ser/Thr protein kinase)
MTSSLQAGFDDRVAGQVSMAVDEALSNIHRHGYKGDCTGSIILRVDTKSTPVPQIYIQIDDEACQVEKEVIKSRNLDEVRPGGIGVFLIKTIMDKAVWSKREEGGMRLTMSKTFSEQKLENPKLRTKTNG